MIRLTILGGLAGLVLSAGPIIVAGPDAGAPPQVNVFRRDTLEQLGFFAAYPTSMLGGVRVAVGDINSDGWADIITAPGSGTSEVRVFDGSAVAAGGATPSLLRSFDAYPGFTGGVFVAAGDVDGDKVPDIITGLGAGASPHVKVFSASSGDPLYSFDAYDPQFTGGVHVAAGDVNGDGRDDIITGAEVTGHVKVFDGANGSTLRDFFAYGPTYNGGVRVGAGDVNGDGFDDIITGTGVGNGHVRVFDGKTMVVLGSFNAFGDGFTGGVYVAGGSVIVSAGAGIGSMTQIYDALDGSAPRSFSPYGGFTGGVFVAASEDVPEPETWFLFSAGFAFLWIAAVLRPRRRR
ncbi:MAG: FG-GAP repeat protein [Acidobacteria bacterium]|nr:FG-GAP repeat protein [Acidobacteriota bacterium]